VNTAFHHARVVWFEHVLLDLFVHEELGSRSSACDRSGPAVHEVLFQSTFAASKRAPIELR
jgi:hypothetical protein